MVNHKMEPDMNLKQFDVFKAANYFQIRDYDKDGNEVVFSISI